MKRSKTIWLRGWIRIRCVGCGWFMMRPPAVFLGLREGPYHRSRGQEEDETIIICPKCKTKSYALVPPERFKITWPPKEEQCEQQ